MGNVIRPEDKSFLPVMLAPRAGSRHAFRINLKPWHGLLLAAICIFSSFSAFAQADPDKASIFEVLLRWMPLLLKGFVFNLVISVCAMAVGTIVGAALGLGQISLHGWLRKFAWIITQFFRNFFAPLMAGLLL